MREIRIVKINEMKDNHVEDIEGNRWDSNSSLYVGSRFILAKCRIDRNVGKLCTISDKAQMNIVPSEAFLF